MVLRIVWQSIFFLRNELGRTVSLSVIATVPLLASLSASLQEQSKLSEINLLSAFLNFLDIQVVEVPPNLLRLFWSSVFFYLCSLLTQYSYPPILQDKRVWYESLEAQRLRDQIRREIPSIVEPELQTKMAAKFEEKKISLRYTKNLFLIPILILFFGSLYLALIIAIDKIFQIVALCHPLDLFSFGTDTC